MKQITRRGFRVMVFPDLPLSWAAVSEDHAIALSEQIVSQIRERIDGVKAVTIWTPKEECSHCRGMWREMTEELVEKRPDLLELPIDGPGLPLCCAAAQAEWRNAQRNAQAGSGS